MKEIIIICREENDGEIEIYPLRVKVTADLLVDLTMRERLNSNVRYFAVLPETWSDDEKRKKIADLLSRPNDVITAKFLQENGDFAVEV